MGNSPPWPLDALHHPPHSPKKQLFVTSAQSNLWMERADLIENFNESHRCAMARGRQRVADTPWETRRGPWGGFARRGATAPQDGLEVDFRVHHRERDGDGEGQATVDEHPKAVACGGNVRGRLAGAEAEVTEVARYERHALLTLRHGL